MDAVKSNAPVIKDSFTTPPAVKFGQNSRDVQDEMSRAGEIDNRGQISLFSSAVPGDFRRDLISSFPKPPNPANYEPYDERNATILEIARENGGLQLVRPRDPDSSAEKRFQEATGVSIVYFRGKPEAGAGFVSRLSPGVIFASAEQQRYPLSWVIAHELIHAVQKDRAFSPGGIYRMVLEKLTPLERSSAIQHLRLAKYKRSQMRAEIPAHFIADAAISEEAFDLGILEKGNELKDLLADWFDLLPILNPQALKTAPDDDLSRLLSSPAPPDGKPAFDPVKLALEKMPKIYADVFHANQEGASTEEIMQRFKLKSPTAVANILKDAGVRIQASIKAAQGTLKPKMQGDQYDGGRPDLAQGGKAPFVAIDQMRNEAGIVPGNAARTMDQIRKDADAALDADFEGQFTRLEQMMRDGTPPTGDDVAMAVQLFKRAAADGQLEGDPKRQ